MSPGQTFERVYLALKEQLRSGRHLPGAQLEPAVLTDELCSSVTPIRDALHRLVGERLVEAPRNDGFRVPILNEFGLRQLYGWQTALLRLAVAELSSQQTDRAAESDGSAQVEPSDAEDPFLALARGTLNSELGAALLNACDRLAHLRELEERFIPGREEELEQLRVLTNTHDSSGFRNAIAAFSRRRDRAVPHIVAALQGSY